jgi:hypothetical protein
MTYCIKKEISEQIDALRRGMPRILTVPLPDFLTRNGLSRSAFLWNRACLSGSRSRKP